MFDLFELLNMSSVSYFISSPRERDKFYLEFMSKLFGFKQVLVSTPSYNAN